jgi:GTP-binding protein EngB required for normal cell division
VDLIQYEQTKFELATILRSAGTRLHAKQSDVQAPFSDLFARLAEDRFNLMVIGRFSRGKSSLMNALLDMERLPMGIVPITSVITTVVYGSRERALIEYENSHLNTEVTLEQLPQFITQQGNPGNQRRVALARIELPSELLRRGFYLVDTPGLGSAFRQNTLTTERFLPQADAFMVVTSFDSPLSAEELEVLRRIAPSASRVFLVINKHDLVSAADRVEVLAHVTDQARRAFGEPVPSLFSVSAREALEANRSRDTARYAASGVDTLRSEVTRFLLTDRQTNFLLRMCERVASALSEVPNSKQDSDRLRAIQDSVAQSRPDVRWNRPSNDAAGVAHEAGFKRCEICEQLDRGLYDFLCHYQWEITTDRSTQNELAERGGLCAFHYWQLGSIASPRTICVGLSPLVDRWARQLHHVATLADRSGQRAAWQELQPSTCELCRTHTSIEQEALASMARRLEGAAATHSGLCLLHLEMLTRTIGLTAAARQLLLSESAALKRLAEDMRRYALQRDGLRRDLASDEDATADRRALMLLGGHPNVFGSRRVDQG